MCIRDRVIVDAFWHILPEISRKRVQVDGLVRMVFMVYGFRNARRPYTPQIDQCIKQLTLVWLPRLGVFRNFSVTGTELNRLLVYA